MTRAKLRQRFRYDPETGEFLWYKRAKYSNATPGTIAGSISMGYRMLYCQGEYITAARAAWLWVYGKLPNKQIDHINGNRLDNRICNLRDVSAKINCRNRKRPANNTSGLPGVRWHKRDQSWHVSISTDYKRAFLGCFKDFFEACCTRKSAEVNHRYVL